MNIKLSMIIVILSIITIQSVTAKKYLRPSVKESTTSLESVVVGRSYYVSPNGSNSNNGLTKNSAWKSLYKINNVDLNPGDVVYLKGGATFTGYLNLTAQDRGSANNYVTITSYDGNGQAAKIYAQNGVGISVSNAPYVKLSNLTVYGNGVTTGNTANGVSISNCYKVIVERMNISGFQHTGLFVYKSNNATIKWIEAHHNGAAGIGAYGDKNSSRSRNLYIGNCKAYANSGDPTVTQSHSGSGILAGLYDNITIEYSYAHSNGGAVENKKDSNGPVGVWIYESDNSKIQYCISKSNKTFPGDGDGGGFDFDGGVSNSIMQYNISYDNEGSGIGLFQYNGASVWKNNIIRYNISQNDGKKHGGSLFIWNGYQNLTVTQKREKQRHAYIYNNTFYNIRKEPIQLQDNLHNNFNFMNNIIYYKNNEGYIRGTINRYREKFSYNLWYAENSGKTNGSYLFKNNVNVGLFGSPEFILPGEMGMTDPRNIHKITNYRLNSNSWAKNSAAMPSLSASNIPEDVKSRLNVQKDILKNNVPSGPKPDRGAVEYGYSPKSSSNSDVPKEILRSNLTILDNPTTADDISFKLGVSTSGNKQQNSNKISKTTVQLLDITGKSLYYNEIARNLVLNKFTLDMSNKIAKEGLYILKIQDGDDEYLSKVIIEAK